MATSARQYFLNKDKATTTYVDEQIAMVSGGAYANPITFVSENGIDGSLSEDDWTIFSSIVTEKAQGLVVVDLPVKIKDNYTIPSGVSLYFTPEGYFYVSSGMKLTFQTNSRFNDADHGIFIFEDVVRVEGLINHSYWRPEWFGANPEDINGNFGGVINEWMGHQKEVRAGAYPNTFRFKNQRAYYTTDPVEYKTIGRLKATTTFVASSGAVEIQVDDTTDLASAGTVYGMADDSAWVGITYTSTTSTKLLGTTYSRSNVGLASGIALYRTDSYMNDFVLESESAGSRWGGAVLRSAVSGHVINGGVDVSPTIMTRCAFRGLQFRGAGDYGEGQTDYVVDASRIDLAVFENCGFFYCNYGLYMQSGGAGAGIFTNGYFVNLTTYNTMMLNIGLNMRMDTCIIENSNCIVHGNSTEPFSLTNCHLEHSTIRVPKNTFHFGGPMGSTNSCTFYLMPETCNSRIDIREVGSYVYNFGHNNFVRGGFRFAECEGTPSNVVNMAYGSTREVGQFVLNSGVPWLLSIGISMDGATPTPVATDYEYLLYDMSSCYASGNVNDATVYKSYGTIDSSAQNSSRFLPIPYKQQWDCVVPSGNVWVQPSHDCNFRATRTLNRNPLMRYSDVSGSAISKWHTYSAVASGLLSGEDGRIHIENTAYAAPGGYNAWSFGQVMKLEYGKTYVALMRVINSSGTHLPELGVNVNVANPGLEYQSQELIDVGDGSYMGLLMFRPRNNRPTTISFGRNTAPHYVSCDIDYVAVAELGDYTKYISNGLPDVGCFYKGDTIYDEFPDTNGVSMYLCRSQTPGNYGANDVGVALNKGTWAVSGVYRQGECWKYSTRIYLCRATHSGIATIPSSDTTNWNPLETIDADGVYMVDGNSMFTEVGIAGTNDHGGLTGLGDDDHPQYILADGTRAFTDVVEGVTPTEDAHLATKAYVDDKIINVIDFGADPTGATDSSDAIQAAIDSATGGGIVHLNVGKGYAYYGIAKTIRLTNDITLQGAGHFNTHIFALSGFYTNTGVTFLSATSSDNILDDAGWPVMLCATGGSGVTPTQSHTQLKDFALYPRVYSEWTNLDNSDKMHDSTGVYGMFYEFEAHNMGSHGFRRCFNIGINNGTLGGAGISYFGEIGIRVFNAIGFVCHGHSLVGHTVGVDVDECSDASFKIHQETSSVGYRIGPKVYNTKINLGSLFNIESQPFVIHPSAKVIIEGFPANSLMSHNFAGHMHQADVQPAVEDGYGFINYIPDGNMVENKLNPSYWTRSGGGASAEITKRRALRKYEGTLSSLNNYDGNPKLWCFPGGVAGDESTFEVYSSGIEHLGFLDIRFSCLNSVGVRARITDSGDSDAELYDSGFISGMAVASNSRPFGENVIAGDLRDKEFNAVGPYVLRLTSDSPAGFMISRAMMYRSQSALQTDLGPHSVVASGIQVASSGIIYTTTSDLTTDFPEIGRLSVLDSNNQWLTIAYSGLDANTFKNCVWSRRFTDLAVNNLNDAATIYRYYDASTDSHQGFGAYNFRSGPVGGDNQSTRVIVGTTLTEDVPHRVVGWTKSLGNQALLGNEHAVLQVYDTSPSGPDRHNQTWIPNSGITGGEYENDWTFIDMMASTSYYAYLEKRAADIAFAGVGFIKPVAQKNGKFMFTATPTEGWWAAGDEILINGVPYYCSVAGDPGTWVTASGSSSPSYSYFPQGW